MRIGIDTNVLVYAHVAGFAEHARVHDWLRGRLAGGDTLVVTPTVLHELVHVMTDGRRFASPVSMPEALAVARSYLDRTNVECLAVGERETSRALQLVERQHLGRKRLADTLLAATFLEAGVEHLATCNPADFRAIAGLALIDPRRRAR